MNVATPSLHVHSRMAPTILASLTAGGRDVESQVRELFRGWKLSKGFSGAAHAEAVNLARCAHLFMLEARSPKTALISTVALEPLLRRLFALITVEQYVCEMSLPRARAWEIADTLLENRPESHLSDNILTQHLRSQYHQHAKFTAAAHGKPPESKE